MLLTHALIIPDAKPKRLTDEHARRCASYRETEADRAFREDRELADYVLDTEGIERDGGWVEKGE